MVLMTGRIDYYHKSCTDVVDSHMPSHCCRTAVVVVAVELADENMVDRTG